MEADMSPLSEAHLCQWVDHRPASSQLTGMLYFLQAVADTRRRGVAIPPAPLAETLARGLPHLAAYITATESKLSDTWHGQEWAEVCERRSKIAFVTEVWGDSSIGEAVDWWLNTAELDDAIRQRAGLEGGLAEASIPAGTPAEHWWWWA